MKLTLALVCVCGACASVASAQVEPILFSDGPIPGVTLAGGAPATIWQSGLFRPRNSPDKSRWAIRVNSTSANDDEYIVVGSGLTGQTVVHSSGTPHTVPPTSVPVFFISERGLDVNDAGALALSGSVSARATTDTIWLIEPGVGATVVATEGVTTGRPGPFPTFTTIQSPTISNTGKIAFAEADTGTAGGREMQAILWTPGAGFSEIAGENDTLANVPGRVVQNINGGEANAQRGNPFFFENPGQDPVVGFGGDLDGLSTDDHFFAVRDNATGLFNSVYRELDVIDGQQIGLPGTGGNIIPVGWIDARGNTYAVPAGGFAALPQIFAFINQRAVIRNGGTVGGTVAGETWQAQNLGFAVSPVVALDQNSRAGYIVGGSTSNTESFQPVDVNGVPTGNPVLKNQVIIYVAPDGTRTELVRIGDPVTVVVNGAPQTRRIVTLAQGDAILGAYVDDTHLYFLAGTEFLAGTVPDDLFARVVLPVAPPSCRPDLNNDGELTFDDIQLFVSLYNANDPRADFNGDQEWTFDDIQLFVQQYNAGC